MIKFFMMIILFPILFISPFIAISMNSWFTIWMILELNLLSFIPFIIFFNKYFKECSLKYFIIQASSSSIFIFFSIINSLMNFNMLNNKINYLIIIMLNLTILMKLGSAPFHSWFINLMNNLSWLNCFILASWQKIIPLMLLSFNFNKFIIIYSALLSSIISSILGNNHQALRMIMSFSSIINLSWMLIILMFSNKLLMLFFILYLLNNISLMMMFNYLNIFYINQMIMLKNNFKYYLMINFFSLANLPPFLGFIMKWSSIIILSMTLNHLLLLIFIMMSLMSFLFYTRIMLSLLLFYKFYNKINLIKFYKMNFKFIKILIYCSPLMLWLMNSWIF
uniref:NADH-ubiquinone oxidoreductase chain 2 n=1 Tax=Enicospilus sp. MD-2008 TaxID=576951 RepID=C4NCI1_9HYME|nr:NADH dehydrogenase subunit 2 [Enicospilus sp. MD-2008]